EVIPMRFLRIYMPVVAVLAGGIGIGWYVHTAPEREARRHREAMERWPALVASGFPGKPRGVAETLRACFRVGDTADEYETLFATGFRLAGVQKWNMVQYNWHWRLTHGANELFANLGHEGDWHIAVFVVIVEGNPQVITEAYISPATY